MFGSFVSSRCWCWRCAWRRACGLSRNVLLGLLQCANVSDYGPPILHGDLRCIRRHGAPAVCNRVEEMSDGCLSQTIVVERRCATEATTHDHAVAISSEPVTRATEDFVAIATTPHNVFGNGDRKVVDIVRKRILLTRRRSLLLCLTLNRLCSGTSGGCRSLSGKEFRIIVAQKPTRDSSRDWLSS